MARPNKYRRVCELPHTTGFGPVGRGMKSGKETIELTIDEYEVLRLMDYEGLNQEECAAQMNVARSTIQRVYNIARKKLVAMLVEGRDIHIEGGNYQVCNSSQQLTGCGNCRRRQGK